MHYNRNATPLLVCSLSQPVAIALFPVPMLNPRPSSEPQLFARFYKPLGKLIPIHEDDALRVRKYMQRYNTEALTSDGQVAFTLHGNQLMQCDPQECGQPPEPLFVDFYPQYWIGDTALPAGATERVDVTDIVLALPAAEIASLRDGTPGASDLVDPEARGHYGPYIVACEAALRSFFDVESLTALTQKMVDQKKAGIARSGRRAAPDLDRGSFWMLGVGSERAFFTCQAGSIDEALAQCRQAFPGQPVNSACHIT